MLKVLWVDLVTFWDQNGAANATKKGPEFGPDFGTKNMQNWDPEMDPKMVPKRLLGEILASSRPSWALLGHQQAFFESSGSTMIASSFFRRFLGLFFFLGLLKLFWGHFWSFSAPSKASLGPLGRLMGSARAFFGSTLVLGRLSLA